VSPIPIADQILDVLKVFPKFLDGFWVTVTASALSLLFALAIGTVVGVLQSSSPRIGALCRIYVEFFQNTPLLVQAFLLFYGLPTVGVIWSSMTVGVVSLSLYTGAYVSEVVRTGIQAIPRGQKEAALSQGMTYLQTMRFVIVPQAMRIILPPLTNQCVNLVKNSALLAAIAGHDLLYVADDFSSQSFIILPTYGLVMLMYLALTLPLSRLVFWLEQRLAVGH
jgi:putative glutamine transport system permease protein